MESETIGIGTSNCHMDLAPKKQLGLLPFLLNAKKKAFYLLLGEMS
jgi:hypothetical protein